MRTWHQGLDPEVLPTQCRYPSNRGMLKLLRMVLESIADGDRKVRLAPTGESYQSARLVQQFSLTIGLPIIPRWNMAGRGLSGGE